MAHPCDDWTVPGAHEVSDGVHRIPLPLPQDGLRAVNVYALEAADGLLLVDGGWALQAAREALEKAVRSLGHSLSDISRFVVTHVHRDHYTQAVTIRREYGSRVALGALERESLERAMAGPDGRSMLALLRRADAGELAEDLLAAGFGRAMEPHAWEPPDEWLTGGERIPVDEKRHLEAIHTPGHTRGHLVFADRHRGLLFTGDHVLPHITPSIGFEGVQAHLPLRDFLDSLERVRELPDMAMLPAHGAPGPSVHQRAAELLAHHENRLALCRTEVRPSGTTGYDVARALAWTSRGRRFQELDPFNQMLAVSETLAHLDVLVSRGVLSCAERADVRVYAC
ncbi:MBL fold metallo-hydrolase [Acrocarpospora pleiomorpha]|uniref:MBL fold metallo-hydrolase n=1 Tax=Acrocarpospora pleiomorpha TaxID=90975 RepID=A0A5M3XEB1_9ACTN|nr:MBL fold metallo-hydrolase [Acrocarpospora pleiomorpha]GES17263.1 MBL fold metallo-hydrolase [Acrocarpospora pleiomorpha]